MAKVLFHTAATIAPSLILLLIVYQLWYVLDQYLPFALFVFFLSLLPLTAQIGLLEYRRSRQGHSGAVMPLHPFGIVLPIGLLLVIPCWPLGEHVARQFPSLCVIGAGERVMTSRTTKDLRIASFYVHFSGWGNHQDFEFTSADIGYTGYRQYGEDLYVRLPCMRGHYTNWSEGLFPVSQDVIADYVRRTDDFPAQEVESIAGELWGQLNRYANHQNMPPMVAHFGEGEKPRIVSYVPSSTIYLFACCFSLLILTVVSCVLARRYCRRVRSANESNPQA
jgi:hypothetical protein